MNRTAAFPAILALAACVPEKDAGRTVTGRVQLENGVPLPWTVTIQGKTVLAADDGTFSIPGVTGSYDLTASAGQLGIVLLGVTRSDPVVRVPMFATSSGIIRGTISGVTGETGTSLAFCGAQACVSLGVPLDYSIEVPVATFGTVDGTLLAWNETERKYAVVRPVTVTAGQEVRVDLALTLDLPMTTLGGVVATPAGTTRFLEVSMAGPDGAFSYGLMKPPDPPFSYDLPAFPGFALDVAGIASSDAGTPEVASATELRYAVPPGSHALSLLPRAPPAVLAPIPATGATPDTELRWTRDAGELSHLKLRCLIGGTDVFVAADHVRLGDVHPQLVPHEECRWSAELVPAATVDDVAGPSVERPARRRAVSAVFTTR